MVADSAPWRNPRVLSVLLIVFIFGGVSGALTMRLGLHRFLHPAGPAWREGNKEIFLQKFKKELDLTPRQEEQITTVLNDYTMYYKTLQDQLDEVRASGKSRILDVLSEPQKRKFEKMLKDAR